MIPYDFHYQWPAAAYLILTGFFCFALFWFLYKIRQRFFLPNNLLIKRSTGIFWTKAFLLSLTLVFSAIALMDPVGNGHYPEGALPPQRITFDRPLQLKRKAHQVIFLLDVSSSMAINDSSLQQNRLDYAKDIADEIVAGLNGEAIALHTFTSKALQQSPLTNDYIFVRLTLKEAYINEGGIPGTDIAEALTQIQSNYFPPNAEPIEKSKLKTLILLSDGEDTAVEALPESQRSLKELAIADLIKGAGENNVRIYTIGMGTAAGGVVPAVTYGGQPVHSSLNSQLLQAISKKGRGKYFEANRYSPPQLAKELLADMAQDKPYYEDNQQEIFNSLLQSLLGNSGLIYERYIKIFTGFSLLCLTAALLLPDVLKRKSSFLFMFLLLLSYISQVDGQSTQNEPKEWKNEMHRAKVYLQAHLFDEARSIYDSVLNLPISTQQKGVLLYDIGTSYLYQQDFNGAILSLKEAILTRDSYPYFYRYVQKNLALAYYEKALSLQNEDPEAAVGSFEDSLKINHLLPEPDREPLEKTLKVQIAQTRGAIVQEKLLHTDSKDFIQALVNFIEDSKEQLAFVSEQPMNSALLKSYCELFAEQQRNWLGLIENRIENWPNSDQKQSLKEAEIYIRAMSTYTANGQIHSAEKEAQEAQVIFLKLLEQLNKDSTQKGMLRNLLNAYERLLKTKRWKKERLVILHRLYETMDSPQNRIEDTSIQKILEESHLQLAEAIKMSEGGNTLLANILALDSSQGIRLAIAKTSPRSSREILKELIHQQGYLLELESQNFNAEISERLQTLLLARQANLQSLSELYYSILYQEQVKAFREEKLCQAVPWSTALPYFETGRLAAEKAYAGLQHSTIDYYSVSDNQREAVKNWQNTLNEINNPHPQQNSCYAASASKMSQEESSALPDNGITTLLQMEQQDKQPKESAQMPVNTIQRPW